jgi:flagellar motor switch protein FliM
MAEVLSQEEKDQLIDAINAGYTEDENSMPAGVKIYDFSRPDRFSREQIRTVSMIHDLFVYLIRGCLSARLRSTVQVHVASVDQLTYDEFIRSIPTPTTLAIINMEPLKGNAILEIDPEITSSIIDRICGGNGNGIVSEHELSDIEQSIIEGIIVRILEPIRAAWAQIIDLRPQLGMIYTDPQLAQIAPPTDMTLLITLEVKINDIEGFINFCIPYLTIEPIMEKFSSRYWFGNRIRSSEGLELEDIPIKLSAEIFRRDYSIKEIKEWDVGTELLPLRPLSPGHCYLRVGDGRVWQCEILPDNELYAKRIKITGITDKPFGTEGRKMEKSKVNPLVDDALSNVGLTISVEVGTTVKTVKEVRGMGEGIILELDKLFDEPVDVKANGVLIAYGEVVVIKEHFGVHITGLATPADSSDEPIDESPDDSGEG